MTPAQLTTLAAALRADTDPAVVAAVAIGNATYLAANYNGPSSFIVWRSSVPVEDYRSALTWTEVDALTVGKARIWDWITGAMTLPIEASKAAVRQGLADCWASNSTTRPALLAIAKRAATKAERLFATGTGTTAAPGDLGWEGQVTIEDVGIALRDNPA